MRIMARPWQLRFILFFIETLFFCPRGLSTLCIDHGEVCSRGLSAPIPSFRGQIHLYLRGAGQNPGSGTSTRQLPRKKHEGQEQAAGDIKARLNDLAKRVRDPQWTEVIGLLPSLARKDPSLSNAIDGAVVTRFRQPTSPLNIGQAHEILLNHFFARVHRGKLVVTIDDANPTKRDSVESVLQDLELLCIPREEVQRSSKYHDSCLRACTEAIANGEAYIDEDPLCASSQLGGDGESPRSSNRWSVSENIAMWEEMQAGAERRRECCVRARLNISSSDGCIRDPVIIRWAQPHSLASGQHLAPTSELAAPVVDSLQGVTHVLSSPAHRVRDEQYLALCKMTGLRPPELVDIPGLRLELAFTVQSFQSVEWLVDKTKMSDQAFDARRLQGFVDGFDDVRLPTLRGIVRRGLSIKALRAFALSRCMANQTALAEDHRLWALNRRLRLPSAPTFTAVAKEGCCALIVGNFDEYLARGGEERAQTLRNKSDASMGSHVVLRGPRLLLEDWDAASISDSDKVTLKGWGNFRIVQVTERDMGEEEEDDDEQEQEQGQEKQEQEEQRAKQQQQQQQDGARGGESADAGDGSGGSRVLRGDWLPDDNNFKTSKTFTWLPAGAHLAELTPLELQYDGPLLTFPRVNETDLAALESAFNARPPTVMQAWGDTNMRSLQRGAVIHLDRKGLFIVDREYSAANEGLAEVPARLVCIPSGQAVRRYVQS